MRSRRTKRFQEQFKKLPDDVKRQAYAAYRLFVSNPRHPGLHFKKLHGDLYSIRIGIAYRTLGIMETSDLIDWIWIGSHAEYDQIIKR